MLTAVVVGEVENGSVWIVVTQLEKFPYDFLASHEAGDIYNAMLDLIPLVQGASKTAPGSRLYGTG